MFSKPVQIYTDGMLACLGRVAKLLFDNLDCRDQYFSSRCRCVDCGEDGHLHLRLTVKIYARMFVLETRAPALSVVM